MLVGPGLVATAAHTVEGPRRELTVDGSPARVVALDARTDLALLAADIGGTPAETTTDDLDRGTVRTPGGDLEVTVLRTGPLVVDDTTAGTRHERTVHTFSPGADLAPVARRSSTLAAAWPASSCSPTAPTAPATRSRQASCSP